MNRYWPLLLTAIGVEVLAFFLAPLIYWFNSNLDPSEQSLRLIEITLTTYPYLFFLLNSTSIVLFVLAFRMATGRRLHQFGVLVILLLTVTTNLISYFPLALDLLMARPA